MSYPIEPGDIVTVTITGIQPYGAFAVLPDHTSGLIHISEISRVFYSWSGAEFNFCSFFHDFFVKFCEF